MQERPTSAETEEPIPERESAEETTRPADEKTVAAGDEVATGDEQELAAEEGATEEPSGEGDSPMQWYVLKVQSNREKSIRNSLLRRIKRENLEDYFGEVVIPTERVAETKGGKKRVTEQKLYPGYMMIQMVLNDETWYLVRDTSGVGDFTGAAGKPIPMREEEVNRMLGLEETKEAEPAKVRIDFAIGDTVKIKEGTFEGFEGVIDEIEETSGQVTVLIEIFGRSTPVELEYWQVETV